MVQIGRRPGLLLGLGVLTWLVPFLVSVPLVGPGGDPTIDVFAFKTTMILVGAGVGALCFAVYVPRLRVDYLAGAVVAGLVWLGVNVALDLLVLVWFLGTPLGEWIVGVGARYLVLPIFGTTTGYVAARVGPTGGRGASRL